MAKKSKFIEVLEIMREKRPKTYWLAVFLIAGAVIGLAVLLAKFAAARLAVGIFVGFVLVSVSLGLIIDAIDDAEREWSRKRW